MSDKVAPYGLSGVITQGSGVAVPKTYSPEELAAMGAKPVTGPATAPVTFSPEQLQAMGARPVSPINQSAGMAVARGASSGATLGASGWISAAIDTAASKILPHSVSEWLDKHGNQGTTLPLAQDATFDQRRQAYAGAIQETRQANPKTFAASEIAGGIAAPVPGMGAATGMVKGTSAAAKAGRAAIGGAIYGAGSAVGHGLTEGKDLGQIGSDAVLGGTLGAGMGIAGAGLGHIAGQAIDKVKGKLADKYVQTVGSEILGMTSKKATPKAWNQILSKESEKGVEADAAKKFVRSEDMAPVEAAARKGKYDEALEHIDSNLRGLSPGRQANYAQLDAAKQFEVGKGLDALEQALFKAKNQLKKDPTAGKALEHAYNEWLKDFSSAEAGAVQRTLLRPQGETVTAELADELASVVNALPQSGPIVRSQIEKAVRDANASPDAIRYINSKILDPEVGILHWNPKAKISALEIRAEASAKQEAALQAFDKINPNHSEAAKSAVKKAIVGALEKHLDDVAGMSPQLAKAVSRIRNDDVKLSVLLSAKTGIREALEKSRTNQFKNVAGKIIKHATTPVAATAGAVHFGHKAAEDVEKGDAYGALEHGGLATAFAGLAGHGISRYASIGANRLENTAMGQIQAAAAAGNPQAQAIMEMWQRRTSNAVIGTVTPKVLSDANGL